MRRVDELLYGKTAVIGRRDIVGNVVHHVIRACREDMQATKTIVLCDGSAAKSVTDTDKVVRLGLQPEKGEILPEIIEPFLDDAEVGVNIEYIVAALTDMFFANMVQASKDTNEMFFAGLEQGENPFDSTLIKSAPHTAQSIEGSMRTMTGKLHEFLIAMSKVVQRGKFSLGEYLASNDNGILFIELAPSIRRFSSVIFRFFCAHLRMYSESARKKLRLIIPEITLWREPATLNSMLIDCENISIIWGSSNLGVVENIGRSLQSSLSMSMISASDAHVWCRTGEVTAQYVYERIVPEQLRIYSLHQIPESLCFIQSERGEFGNVEIPGVDCKDSPQTRQQNESGGNLQSSLLWRDASKEEILPLIDRGTSIGFDGHISPAKIHSKRRK